MTMKKPMKLRKYILFILSVLPVLLLCHTQTAGAAPSIETLVPNLYEDKEFRDNKEFLRDEANKQKQLVPEEQKGLTFDQRNLNQNEQVQEKLFSGESEPRKTVAIQAEQLNLFSQESNIASANEAAEQSSEDSQSSLKTLYLAILAVAVIIILVFLIPKMAQGSK